MRHSADIQKNWLGQKKEFETEAETRILSTGRVLKGIEYNSSTKGKCENTNAIVTTGSTENCESENDKKVSFDNVTNVG